MIKRKLIEVQSMAKGYGLKKKYDDILIKGVSTDTRTIKEGNLFVPIVGENFDGHRFIDNAISKGAVAALWCSEKEVPDIDFPFILVEDTLTGIQNLSKGYKEELDIKVVGVTGTNGKTSTKDILEGILKTKYKTHKTLGNLNNYLGVPLTLLSMEEDTEIAIIEMGMSSLGEIEVLTKIATPDAAIITNIGNAHLEELKTRDNIVTAKLEIVKGLKEDGLFVYNGDDPLLQERVEKLNLKNKKVTFGSKLSNTYPVKINSTSMSGINFELVYEDSSDFFLPMLGNHQAYNAAASIAVGKHFGLSYDLIREGLKNVSLTSMRNELIKGDGFDILNDSYNANPESTKAALKTIYSLGDYDQRIVVFADMLELGEDEINMHREIGDVIDLDKVDYFFTFGSLAKFAAQEAKLKSNSKNVISFEEKTEIIDTIKKVLGKNSLILLKGSRGMKLEDIANGLLKL